MKAISLGPFCLSAQILDNARLRECSYLFDWARSGSIALLYLFHSNSIISLGYFLQPNLPLKIVDLGLEKTKEVINETLIYGYPYYFLPHHNHDSTKAYEYIQRCYTRTKSILLSESQKLFLMADYINKKDYQFINDPYKAADWVHLNMQANNIRNFHICIMRINLIADSERPNFSIEKCEKFTFLQLNTPFSMDVEDNQGNSENRAYASNILLTTFPELSTNTDETFS